VDNTPTSIVEAYASPDVDDWKEAICSEIESFFLMELGNYLSCHLVVNLWVVNGC
jgi:hypothetical protein